MIAHHIMFLIPYFAWKLATNSQPLQTSIIIHQNHLITVPCVIHICMLLNPIIMVMTRRKFGAIMTHRIHEIALYLHLKPLQSSLTVFFFVM